MTPARGFLRIRGQEIHLRPKTFDILIYLVVHRDRLVSKEELLQQFWTDTTVGEDVLTQSIAELRRSLGDTSRDSRYLKTVPKRGYRFVADVREVPANAIVATEQITTIQVREEYSDDSPPRKYSRWTLAIAVLVMVLVAASALSAWHYWPRPLADAAPSGIHTAIIPFENRSGRPDMDWLRNGLADMLATSLSGSLRIALITASQIQRGLGRSPNVAVPHEDALRAARQAGAKAMITGGFVSLSDVIRVDVQLYDVPTGRLMGGESLTVEKPALLLMKLDPLAARLATRLGAPTAAQTHLAEVMTDNLEAYRLYSSGLERTRNLRPSEAIDLYQKAVALDPAFAMAYARIGFTYASTWGRPAEGKPYLEKAYRLSGRLTPRDRLFIRAWYAAACEDDEGTERAYREILTAFPLEIEAYLALGTLLRHENRYDEARHIFERGLAVEPDMPQLHNMLSIIYLELGRTEQALESARRYVSLSGEPNAYDTLASQYQWVGRYDEAQATYLEAIHRKPDFELALIHLGNLYFQLGRYRKALEQYGEYIRLGTSDVERVRGHTARAWVYWKKGDLATARSEAAHAQGLEVPDRGESLLIEADRGGLALTGDLRRRILSVGADRGGRSIQRIPYFVLGYVALRDHKTDEALDNFRAVLRAPTFYWYIDPRETCLGDALLELGRFDEAIAEYRRVLKMNPNYPMARSRLGLALERKGMSHDARAEFERFMTIWKDADPDIPELVDARRQYGQTSALTAVNH